MQKYNVTKVGKAATKILESNVPCAIFPCEKHVNFFLLIGGRCMRQNQLLTSSLTINNDNIDNDSQKRQYERI